MLKNRNVNKYISKYDNDFCCQVKMTCFIIIVEVSIMMALGRMCHFLSLGPFFFFFFSFSLPHIEDKYSPNIY